MLLLTQARRRIHLRRGGEKKEEAERVSWRARGTGRGRAEIQVLGELRARRNGWEPPHPSLQIPRFSLSISQCLPILVLPSISDFPLAMEDIG